MKIPQIFKRIRKIFLIMPLREKIAAVILLAALIISIFQTIASHLRFPIVQKKDILTEGIVGRVKTLNPLFTDLNDADRDVSQLIFSGLVKYDPVKRNYFPDLAEAWERSPNGKIYSFTIRKNAYWHDGASVTPDDVLFTFQIIQDPEFRNPVLKEIFTGVAVSKPNENTITFTLPKANSYFISYLTIGVIPKHLLADAPVSGLEKNDFSKAPVGSGPYKVSSVDFTSDGDTINLERFDQFYGDKPVFAKMKIYTFPDEKELIAEKNALYAMGKLSYEGALPLQTDPRLKVYPYTLSQFTALYFNTDNTFLNEKETRKALSMALDKNELVLAGEKRIDTIGLDNTSSDPVFAYNPERAKKILSDAGFSIGTGSALYNNKGDRVALNLLMFGRIPDSIAQNIKNKWQVLGIDVKIEKTEQDFYKYVSERRYDILLIRQNLGYNRDVYPLFHSSQITATGLNFANFRSFRTDGITEALRKEKNPRDKEKLLSELSKAISEEIPVIFVSTPVYFYALDKKITAFPVDKLIFHKDRFGISPYLSFQN